MVHCWLTNSYQPNIKEINKKVAFKLVYVSNLSNKTISLIKYIKTCQKALYIITSDV